jgi:hypothetical protein
MVLSPLLGLMTRFFNTVRHFVYMGRPFWREDGSVLDNCSCLRQRSHSQVRVPRGSWPPSTVSDLRLPQPGWPGPCIYIPQEQGGPIIPSGTGFNSSLHWLTDWLTDWHWLWQQLLTGPGYNILGRTAYKTIPPLLLCSLVAVKLFFFFLCGAIT